jgi:hypothetical protein
MRIQLQTFGPIEASSSGFASSSNEVNFIFQSTYYDLKGLEYRKWQANSMIIWKITSISFTVYLQNQTVFMRIQLHKPLALLWLAVVALLAPVMKSTSFFKHKWLYSSRRFVLLCTKASALALTLSSGSGLTENLKLEKTFGESAASWRKIRNLDVVCIFCICKYVCM